MGRLFWQMRFPQIPADFGIRIHMRSWIKIGFGEILGMWRMLIRRYLRDLESSKGFGCEKMGTGFSCPHLLLVGSEEVSARIFWSFSGVK